TGARQAGDRARRELRRELRQGARTGRSQPRFRKLSRRGPAGRQAVEPRLLLLQSPLPQGAHRREAGEADGLRGRAGDVRRHQRLDLKRASHGSGLTVDLKHWKLDVDADHLAWLAFERAGTTTNTFSS